MEVAMDVKTVLRELQNYEVNPWDIRGLFHRAITKEIYNRFGIYIGEKEIVEMDTIENSVQTTAERIEARYGSIENAILHHGWVRINGSIRLNEHTEKETKFYVWEHRLSEFILMLRYAINGFFDKDYHEVNEFMSSAGIKYDTDKGTFKLMNVTFVVFKNHNVTVKGLSSEQYKRIVAGYESYKKYMNV